MIVLTEEARKELEWWVENLQLTKGKTLINPQPQITISTDASLEGWGGGGGGGGYCQGQKKRRTWTCQEKKDHINILELRAVKYAILTFSRLHPKARSLYIQMNSENKSLCVCHHIDLYLDKMKEFHKTEAQLLLSFIKPHKGVTTISRWILEVLHLSGINIEVFTGH